MRSVHLHFYDGAPFEEGKHKRKSKGKGGGQFGEGGGGGSGGAGGAAPEPKTPFTVRAEAFKAKSQGAARARQQEKTGSPLSAEEHQAKAAVKGDQAAAEAQALKDWGEGVAAYKKLRESPEFGAVIDKLPPYQGDVSRGMLLPPDEARFFTAGRTFTLSKHSSATTNPQVAEHFAAGANRGATEGKIPMVLDIVGARGGVYGKDESGPWGKSARQSEAEVILKAGGRVSVESVERTEKGLRVRARWVS